MHKLTLLLLNAPSLFPATRTTGTAGTYYLEKTCFCWTSSEILKTVFLCILMKSWMRFVKLWTIWKFTIFRVDVYWSFKFCQKFMRFKFCGIFSGMLYSFNIFIHCRISFCASLQIYKMKILKIYVICNEKRTRRLIYKIGFVSYIFLNVKTHICKFKQW